MKKTHVVIAMRSKISGLFFIATSKLNMKVRYTVMFTLAGQLTEVIDWNTPVDLSVMLERYSDFHPSILAVMK